MTQRTKQHVVHGPGWRLDVVARLGLDEPRERRLVELCDRWHVTALELFGSVLREDFGPTSDIDVLVTFHPEADWGLLEHAAMAEDLASLLGRPVDLLTRRSVEHSANPIRRASILREAVPLLSTGRSPASANRVGT
jgi:predicted nucleotidyltransferase